MWKAVILLMFLSACTCLPKGGGTVLRPDGHSPAAPEFSPTPPERPGTPPEAGGRDNRGHGNGNENTNPALNGGDQRDSDNPGKRT